jgi:hypothetical protein
MSLSRKGSRPITVDGTRYRWYVRRKPSYGQGLAQSNLTVAVELDAPARGSVLVVDVGQPRPDNWLGRPAAVVTPRDVAEFVREARRAGWRPEAAGSPFTLVTAVRPTR